jgi:CHAD domain-containing protein
MSGGTIVIGRGLRFDVDPDFDPPDLRPVVGHTFRLPEQEIRTVYFDTADMRLWERGLTLRHRRTLAEGDRPGDEGPGTWILELSGSSGDSPDPSDLSWSGGVDTIPEEARRVVAGVVRREPLSAVATLSTTRRRLLLQEPEVDRPWAEIDDDLVTVTAGPEPGRRFRQMELELSAGARAFPVATEAVMAELRSAGAAPTGRPKLAVALELPDAPVAAERGGPSRPARAADVVAYVIGRGLQALLDQDYRLRLAGTSGPDVESVHQARVATRRLRSDLRGLADVLDPVWARHVSDDLHWLGSALGALRDLDVVVARLERARPVGDDDALEPLLHLAANERRVAALELGGVLGDPRYMDLLDRLHAATQSPPLVAGEAEPGRAVVTRVVARHYAQLEQRAARLDRRPDDRSLHRLRIEAKRVRYAAEVAEAVLGRPARRTARRAKALQTVLGEVHDAAMASEWLRQQASHPSITPATAFVAGELACRIEHARADLRKGWKRDLRRLSAKKVAKAWSG